MSESAANPKHQLMMRSGQPCAVIVRSDLGKTSPGEVRIQIWDKKQRTRRALKFWLYCWCLSLISVILPLLHFVLVPGFFLAGPLGAWLISTQGSQILGGQSVCPECSAFLPLAPAADNWPLQDLCARCHKRMKIELAPQPGVAK